MDFSLSAEQRELTEAAAAFARRELNQDLVKRDDAGEFPREAWRACAECGIQGLPVPAELGGAGSDVLTTAGRGRDCQSNSSMEWERSCLFASWVGAMRGQLDACLSRLKLSTRFCMSVSRKSD